MTDETPLVDLQVLIQQVLAAQTDNLEQLASITSLNLAEDFAEADLSHTSLISADLIEADLRGTNLSSANLCHVNLRGADLRGANLSHANLSHADRA